MSIKNFLGKIGRGIKKTGRWIKDKALPAVGRIAKPILNAISILPGKIGTIGRLGGAITDVLHDVTNKIPNKEARDRINSVIDKGNDKFQGVVDRGKDLANGANRTVGIGREMLDTVKNGLKNQIKPAVPSPSINHQIAKFMLPNAQ